MTDSTATDHPDHADHTGITRRRFLQGLGAGGALAAVPALATADSGEAAAKPGLQPKVPRGPRTRPPNVLLIMSDQERGWPDLPGNLGLEAHERLLEAGVGFTHFNANTTPCSPSRSNLYTGQHTQHTRINTNIGAFPFPSLDPSLPTLGHMLRQSGYTTAYKGKWHLSEVPADPNVHYGEFADARNVLEPFGFSDYSHVGITDGATWSGFQFDGATASEASLWLREQGKAASKPWFLAVNFINPHDICWFDQPDHQFQRTREHRSFLSPMSPPPTEGVYKKYWDLPLPKSYYTDPFKHKPWAQTSYREDCNRIFGHIDRKDEPRWRAYQSFYFNCIRDMDRHVTTVLDTLQATGLADDTIVIYVADHGDMLGAHGLRQKGPTMYKENTRVPFIVRHPDVTGGSTTEALGSAVDLVPTVLSLCGVDRAKQHERFPQLKGADLSAAVASSTARTARDQSGHLFDYDTTLYVDPQLLQNIMHENTAKLGYWDVFKAMVEEGRIMPNLDHPGLFRGVFDGRYKFARYFKPSQYHIPKDWKTLTTYNQLELYDTHTDPDEVNNLAADADRHRPLIESLNAKTNALIAAEIGVDDGSSNPGPDFLYRLHKSA